MLVVIAGASGLLGRALVDSLRADGHTVRTLVRRPAHSADEHQWAPERGELPSQALEGANGVVCLSGAGVGDKRWTAAYKRTLVESRIGPVATLARAMASSSSGPQVLLAASAVGYYGDRGDEPLTESSPPGAGFLADLCVKWEAAARPAAEAGIRVATLRTGIVLTARGGALAQLRTVFRLGAGGPLAGGRQYMSWISLADEIAAMRHLLEHEVSGAVNLTGPDPATNREFTRELAKRLHRPAVLPVPAAALRLALGEFGNEAASGQRALPAVLTESGFAFSHPSLGAALDWALAER